MSNTGNLKSIKGLVLSIKQQTIIDRSPLILNT